MGKKQTKMILIVSLVGMSGSFYAGTKLAIRGMRKRLHNAIPLVENALAKSMRKAIEENLTVEEIQALIAEELASVNLVGD